jgi:hypothetical protein
MITTVGKSMVSNTNLIKRLTNVWVLVFIVPNNQIDVGIEGREQMDEHCISLAPRFE